MRGTTRISTSPIAPGASWPSPRREWTKEELREAVAKARGQIELTQEEWIRLEDFVKRAAGGPW